MVKYLSLTKKDLVTWQREHPVESDNRLSDMHLEYFADEPDDRVVVVLALNDGRIVGRNFVFYCLLRVHGQPLECIVTGDLFVDEAFRAKGVGTYIKMHVLNLDYPQITSGVSGPMRQIYDSWSAYTLVDGSPIYSLPLDFPAVVRYARLHYYRAERQGRLKRFSLPKVVLGTMAGAMRVFLGRSSRIRILGTEQAGAALDRVLNTRQFPIQVPWNRDKIVAALEGRADNMLAWVLEDTAGGVSRRYLATAYLRNKEARFLGTGTVHLKEAHLNEVFPPLDAADDAKAVLGCVARELKRRRISTLKIYGNTPALVSVAEGMGLMPFETKSIYVAPRSTPAVVAAALKDPAQWWCRAINEVQFQEAKTA